MKLFLFIIIGLLSLSSCSNKNSNESVKKVEDSLGVENKVALKYDNCLPVLEQEIYTSFAFMQDDIVLSNSNKIRLISGNGIPRDIQNEPSEYFESFIYRQGKFCFNYYGEVFCDSVKLEIPLKVEQLKESNDIIFFKYSRFDTENNQHYTGIGKYEIGFEIVLEKPNEIRFSNFEIIDDHLYFFDYDSGFAIYPLNKKMQHKFVELKELTNDLYNKFGEGANFIGVKDGKFIFAKYDMEKRLDILYLYNEQFSFEGKFIVDLDYKEINQILMTGEILNYPNGNIYKYYEKEIYVLRNTQNKVCVNSLKNIPLIPIP